MCSAPKDPEKYIQWRKNLSEKAKLRGNNGNTSKGYHHTEENKIKISVSSKSIDEKTRSKMSNSAKIYWKSLSEGEKDNRIKKMRSGSKNVNRSLIAKKMWLNLTFDKKEKMLNSWINSKKYSNTKPEQIFEQLLINKGLKRNVDYFSQKWIQGYRVDFFIPLSKIIIEVQGCFFHACELCGHNIYHLEVRKNDLKKREKLESCGYFVKYVWEHQLIK